MAYKIKQRDLSMDSNILSTKDYDIVIDLPNIFPTNNSQLNKTNEDDKDTEKGEKSIITKEDK